MGLINILILDIYTGGSMAILQGASIDS
jgi:hypothetical protein